MEATAADPATVDPNGDVPLEGEGEAEEKRTRIVLEGDGQLSLGVGGKNPTDSEVKLTGGSIDFEGQLKKGDRIGLIVHVRCAAVEFVDKIDSATGDIVATTRRHRLRVEGVSRVPEA